MSGSKDVTPEPEKTMNLIDCMADGGCPVIRLPGLGMAFGNDRWAVRVGPLLLSVGGMATTRARYDVCVQCVEGKCVVTREWTYGHREPAKRTRAVTLAISHKAKPPKEAMPVGPTLH